MNQLQDYFHQYLPNNRFISTRHPRHILIYACGRNVDDGHGSITAGCGFVYAPSSWSYDTPTVMDHGVSFRLETRGPFRNTYPQTCNRAQLRAVVAALQYGDWDLEGWRKVVIGCDSMYVISGVRRWLPRWAHNGWLNVEGSPISDADLWFVLLQEMMRYAQRRLRVRFLYIPQEWNREADQLARAGARMPEVEDFSLYPV